jgi:hypothetical protein
MSRKLSSITRTHSLLLVGNRLFAMFQPVCFTPSEFSRIYSLLNALLLVSFTLVDARTGRGTGNLGIA